MSLFEMHSGLISVQHFNKSLCCQISIDFNFFHKDHLCIVGIVCRMTLLKFHSVEKWVSFYSVPSFLKNSFVWFLPLQLSRGLRKFPSKSNICSSSTPTELLRRQAGLIPEFTPKKRIKNSWLMRKSTSTGESEGQNWPPQVRERKNKRHSLSTNRWLPPGKVKENEQKSSSSSLLRKLVLPTLKIYCCCCDLKALLGFYSL